MPSAPNERILFVDDEPYILDGFKRQFRQEFAVVTAQGGALGLQQLSEFGPFAVVVSDFRMPGMDGIQFLTQAHATCPDTVRIMLTGNADVETAMQAINEGHIFRFLSKPCPPPTLRLTIRAALEQRRLIAAERELLEKTLHGSVKVLTDVLALVNPGAFGRASRIKRHVRGVAEILLAAASGTSPASEDAAKGREADLWQYELAAMLSQIGCLTLPPELLEKVYAGQALDEVEQQVFDTHPAVGHDLIANIPRLEAVAEMIVYQEKRYDGSGVPSDSRQGREIPLGARILKAVLDLDVLVSAGVDSEGALESLRGRVGRYDPAVLAALRSVLGLEAEYQVRRVMISELTASMILAEDVSTRQGRLLITRGYQLSDSMLRHLENFSRRLEIREPICVLVPVQKAVESRRAESSVEGAEAADASDPASRETCGSLPA